MDIMIFNKPLTPIIFKNFIAPSISTGMNGNKIDYKAGWRLQSGAAGFLEKPFEMQELAVVVMRALRHPENEIGRAKSH